MGRCNSQIYKMKLKVDKIISNIMIKLGYPGISPSIQIPKNSQHGDFTTNVALQISSKTGQDAKLIANNIIELIINENNHIINKAEVAGPGFINIIINKQYFFNMLPQILKEDMDFGKSKIFQSKKALIEFVSANPTGPLTVAHGRGAILGHIVSNILEWNGYKVEKEYYFNNAGRQMRKLAESVKARYLEIQNKDFVFPDNGYEGEYIYDIAKNILDKYSDTTFNEDNLDIFKEEAESLIFLDIKNTLNKLGLKFDNFFNENFLYESGDIKEIVDRLRKQNLAYDKDGAVWVKTSSMGREKDKVIIKSTGEPTYRLPDIAYHQNKYLREYDLLIDIFGSDHQDAYPDVLAVLDKLGYDPKIIKVLIHQFVTILDNGQQLKMSTRKANFITLNELIERVGSDVVHYFFIMRGMNTHLNFDLKLAQDESDQNPVYYIQYAYARTCNILKYAEELNHKYNQSEKISLLDLDEEINIIKNLIEFPNIIKNSLNTLEPQTIAQYLQNLASSFHKYYSHHRLVSSDPNKTSARITLVRAIQIVMRNGLKILNISAPEKM